jgi:hypothetical protein
MGRSSERRSGWTVTRLAVIAILALAAVACGDSEQAEPEWKRNLIPRAPADTAVAKIVFVDQLFACACTMTRIDKSWKTLQRFVDGTGIPVERIHLDKDEAAADRYDDMASLVVPPGIYFLDSGGALIKMLQGELSGRQISDVLQTRKKQEVR